MRTPREKKPTRRIAPAIAARLSGHFSLQMQADGSITAFVNGYSVNLGQLSTAAMDRARNLADGLPLASFAGKNAIAREVDVLVHRLARHGLLEYRLSFPRDEQDLVIIEPQVPEYWPQRARLGEGDTVVLSRFAYLRRRGNEMVLESPRAGALFRIGDPGIGATLTALSRPQKISRLRRHAAASFNLVLLELLLDSQILLKPNAKSGDGVRVNEGDGNLVLWDFHDLVFHTRSTEGRQANPVGSTFAHANAVSPLPAVRPPWPGKRIDLCKFSAPEPISPFARLLRERHSIRDFDDQHPVTFAELAQFLDTAARVLSEWKSGANFGVPEITYSARPYPSAGSAYELELYLAVSNCEGLERGFYHYDAGGHALVAIGVPTQQLQALSAAAEFAMDAPGPPQVLITIAARFGRISWKYSSIAYSLILKDVGSMIQTFYLTATDMGLGGCAIGTGNIDLFAKMTELEFHVEGPVGQFALGRGKKLGTPR